MKKVRAIRHLERAWHIIEENARTSKSEDVRKEVEAFRENASRNLKSLSSRLQHGTFAFPAAKGLPIPKIGKDGKKSNSKFRPIVLATVESRVVQRAILDVLLGIPDLQKYVHTKHSFGGIRKQSESGLAAVPAAIQGVLNAIGDGARFVACADISSFFTKIPKKVVTDIVSDAVQDQEFMGLFRKAIHVELSNMAELREKSNSFPIGDIGVAQGNSLSPLLGNIVLYEFDEQMNVGDCRCIRYIDDFLILAPTKAAAMARMKRSRSILSKYGMELSKEKSSKEPIPITGSFEFLGIEMSNGFIRPSSKAQLKHLNSLKLMMEESAKAIRLHRPGAKFSNSNSLVSTLRRVSGMCQGWGKHYRFCNDGKVFENVDKDVSELIRAFIGSYSDARNKIAESEWRALLGVETLSGIELTPFAWPKSPGAS